MSLPRQAGSFIARSFNAEASFAIDHLLALVRFTEELECRLLDWWRGRCTDQESTVGVGIQRSFVTPMQRNRNHVRPSGKKCTFWQLMTRVVRSVAVDDATYVIAEVMGRVQARTAPSAYRINS